MGHGVTAAPLDNIRRESVTTKGTQVANNAATTNIVHGANPSACPLSLVQESRRVEQLQAVTDASAVTVGHVEDSATCPQHVLKELRRAVLAQAVNGVSTTSRGHGEDPATCPRRLPSESKTTQVLSSMIRASETHGEDPTARPKHVLREWKTTNLTHLMGSVPPASIQHSRESVIRSIVRGSKVASGLVVGMPPSRDPSACPQLILMESKRTKVAAIPVPNKARGKKPTVAQLRCAKQPLPMSFLAVTLLLYRVCGALAGRIVVDPHVTAVWGKNVTLRCIFEGNENITQISWEKVLGKNARNVAVHHPEYGNSFQEGYQGRAAFKSHLRHDATLVISNIDSSDLGQYVCKAATFPSGNVQSTTTVTVIVEPSVSLIKGPHPLIDEGNLTVAAICTAANGKPPADVRWEGGLGETELSISSALNDTVTVMSQYKLIPTRFAQGRPITCVVNHPALENEVRYPYILDIQYAPEVSVTGHDGNWFVGSENLQLWCNADANPPPSEFAWSRLDGQWPERLLPMNNTLLFNTFLTHNHSGIYVCTVTNALGQRSDQKSIRILDPPTTPTLEPTVPQPQETTGTTLSKKGHFPTSTLDTSGEDSLGTIIGSAVGGVLLVILVIVLAVVICYQRRQTFRGDYFTKNYTPPSGMQKESQVDVLQTDSLGPYPEASKQDQHPMNHLILSQYMGSMHKPNWNTVDSYNNRYQEQFERPVDYYEGNTMPMATKHPHEDGYDENEDDFVSHVDGSVISRKEWYV